MKAMIAAHPYAAVSVAFIGGMLLLSLGSYVIDRVTRWMVVDDLRETSHLDIPSHLE